MSAQPTGVRKPDQCQVRASGLTSVVGIPQGGRAGKAAGSEATEAVRRRKQVCGLRSAAEDVNSLARLEPMGRVGELDLRQRGLLTDTYLSFGNGAEGGVAVEPEAVFHGWPQAGRECLPGGTQWSGSRAGATCRSG